jgi:hypothetical protein
MELKRQFISGKMNKDLDLRIIPDGEYIDALNVIVSNSEGQKVGSVQNVYGLEFVSTYQLPVDAVCIGSVADEANSCIYWLVYSASKNIVLEYSEITGNTSVVLEDNRASGSNVLNFDPKYYVTGINVVYNSFNRQKLLVWTDNLNDIRCVNVDRAKGYGLNGFNSDDISLYKKPPFEAPVCTPTIVGTGVENNIKERFLSFAYRYKYLDGEYSALSAFSNPQFYPANFRLDYLTQENSGMINQFNGIKIEFNTGDRNVTDIQLVFRESNSSYVYVIDTFNKSKKFWSDGLTKDFVFSNNKIYSILPEDEIKRLFDNVPLKAQAQEFIGNRLIYGNYVEGRDLIDIDGKEVKADFDVDYVSESFSDSEVLTSFEDVNIVNDVVSIDFTNKPIKKDNVINISFRAISDASSYGGISVSGTYSSGSTCNVTTSSPHGYTTGDSLYFKVTSGLEMSQEVASITVTSSTDFYFNSSTLLPFSTSGNCQIFEYKEVFFGGSVYNCDVSYYCTKDYANAQDLSLDPDFINFISVVATENFKNNSQIAPVDNEDNGYVDKFQPFQIISSTNVNFLKIKLPFVKHSVWTNYPTVPEVYDNTNFIEYMKFVEMSMLVTINEGSAFASCKTNRSYECGIVYLDETGRYSTVITNETVSDGTVFIPISESEKKNQLKININHKAPKWANRYKIFVKDNKLEYQNIYATFVFKDGNYLWLKLEGLENQKVSIGDNLILKRDLDGPNDVMTKIEVLDYKTQAPDFITSTPFEEPSGNYIKIKNIYSIDFANAEQLYKEVEANSAMKNGKSTARSSLFTTFDGTSYTDYEIKSGSKVTIFYRNEKGGSSGGRYVFEKEFVALNTYPNFYDFYQSEVISATPFTTDFFRVADGLDPANPFNQVSVSGSGYLYCGVTSIMNGNGQNRTYMYTKITILSSDNLLIFETDPKDKSSQIFYETQDTYLIDSSGNHLGKYSLDQDQDKASNTPCEITLNYFNCYSQGNGAESYIVRDKFNGNFLSTATRGNGVEIDGYNQTRNIASLTYSGAFDETLNYNSLNEFNLSRANYKDLDDRYGSIQKLFTKDTNLIVFQQYKVHNILYTKNILFDSVGGGQVASVESVLGNEVPYAGEFGISNHPESFAFYGNNLYFTDSNKRAVLRLGADGIQPISGYGMISEFVKMFDQYTNNFIFGGFDDKKQQYYITFSDLQKPFEPIQTPCNSIISGRLIPTETVEFEISVPKQSFSMNIPYVFSAESTIVVSDGVDTSSFNRLLNDGSVEFLKTSNSETITLSLSTEEDLSQYTVQAECPEINTGEVVLLVVNDSNDSGKSIKTGYTWNEVSLGLNGGDSNNEIFEADGVSRFEATTGYEGVNEIPQDGSIVEVYVKDGSFDFKPCNRIGYVVTEDVLSENDVLSGANWLPLAFSGSVATGSFTFVKPTEASKLYIVWDCSSSVVLEDDNVSLNQGETLNINVLGNDSYDGTVTVDIVSGPSNGTAVIVDNEIVYTNTSGSSDFIIYSVTDEFGCSYQANINIAVNSPESCFRFTSFKYLSNVLEGESETIQFQYTDCSDVVQTIDFTIPTLSDGNPFLYKEYVFNDEVGDPIICCKSGTVVQSDGNIMLAPEYNTYSESIFCSI